MKTDVTGNLPWIHLGAFWRALLPMLVLWGGWVGLAWAGGYPGVVCMTPLAWLLALWSGKHYAALTAGWPLRWPLLAPALLGAAMGLAMGVMVLVVGWLGMPPGEDDVAQTATFLMLMAVPGVLACSALSVLTAWLTRRRLLRSGELEQL